VLSRQNSRRIGWVDACRSHLRRITVRLRSPRIEPLQREHWNDAQRKVLEPFAQRNQLFNIYSTLGQNPDALTAFLAWGSYVLRRASLPARERELVILRVGYLCRAGYEWAQHSRLGKQVGLTASEVERIKCGSAAADWSDADRTLLVAAEELQHNHFIDDATWQALRCLFTEQQCMDLVFVVGHYTQVCMILNTFGIQLDTDLTADPDLQSFASNPSATR
jgi:alkylhydroperoxidase family enzyme